MSTDGERALDCRRAIAMTGRDLVREVVYASLKHASDVYNI